MKKIIVANWKMYLDTKQSLELFKDLLSIKKYKHDLIVCPDYLALSKIVEINKNKLTLGAQNCADLPHGAMTGEVSAEDIKNIGAEYVIIGHSERRRRLKEDNSLINAKIHIALQNNLKVILCLGESLLEKKSGRTRPVLYYQLKGALKGVKLKSSSSIMLAYEPVWAIGNTYPMPHEEVSKMHKYLSERTKKLTGKNIKILYGGSINSDNASDYLKQKQISGLLVGRASTQFDSLQTLINI